MATWMICEYYGASLNPAKPNNGLPINDELINLDLCESIQKGKGTFDEPMLIFFFNNSQPIRWEFINEELRDLEYNRAIDLIKEATVDVLN